jgi:hypothetical protein
MTRTATTQIADQLPSSKNRNLLTFLKPKLDLKNKSLAFLFQEFFIQKVIEAWKDCKKQEEEKGRLNQSSLMELIQPISKHLTDSCTCDENDTLLFR